MDDDPWPHPGQQPTAQEYMGQRSDSEEEPDIRPQPDPPPDHAGSSPVGVDDEHSADSEHYDSEHFEPL